MRFFEAPPPPPEPPQHRQPEWVGPPENVLPAPFPLALTVARTERVAFAVHTGLAYPNGFTFGISLRLRDEIDHHVGSPFRHFEPTAELTDEMLRFGIRFADGAKATIFDGPRWYGGTEQPPGPVLLQRGGSGGTRTWEMTFWVWPLPPPGPFAFVCEWPSEGIDLREAEIDSTTIRKAAARAELLWPEHDEPSPGGGAVFSRQIAFGKMPDE